MNKESNKYTLIYASVMVILVAVGLALTSQVLKERQHRNEQIDKMRQILRAINIQSDAKDAEKKFKTYIVSNYAIDAKANKLEQDAFSVELVDELKKKPAQRKYPVFEAKIDGKTYYVLAMRGVGLWGPLWGYIALADDKDTVYGADFSHQGETPGLGAEITLESFSRQFAGKQIFKSGQFKSVAVIKSGNAPEGQDYVDGISGGTITSQGVNAMLYNSLQVYESWLKSKSN